MSSDTRARHRLVVLSSTALVLAIIAALLIRPFHEPVTEAVREAGPAAPLAFVAFYVVLTLLLVPGSVLTVAGGVLFGPLYGAALAVVGGIFGSTLAFVVGRYLARQQVVQLGGRRTQMVDRWLAQRGILAIAIVRIVPGVPYSLLNYTAGVTGISTRDYVLGSALGLVPGAVAYAMLGGSLHDPLSLEFAGAIGLVIAVLATGAYLNRRIGPQEAHEPSA